MFFAAHVFLSSSEEECATSIMWQGLASIATANVRESSFKYRDNRWAKDADKPKPKGKW
jgi:hypothetical protein